MFYFQETTFEQETDKVLHIVFFFQLIDILKLLFESSVRHFKYNKQSQ